MLTIILITSIFVIFYTCVIENFNQELEYLTKIRNIYLTTKRTNLFTNEDRDLTNSINVCSKIDPMMYLSERTLFPPRWLIKTYNSHKLPGYISANCINKYSNCLIKN